MPVNEFEKQVQRKLEELQFRPSPEVWTEVEKQIRKEKKRRRVLIFWWLLPVLLTGGIATWYLVNRNAGDDKVANNEQSATQSATDNLTKKDNSSTTTTITGKGNNLTPGTNLPSNKADNPPVSNVQSTDKKKSPVNNNVPYTKQDNAFDVAVDKPGIVKKQQYNKIAQDNKDKTDFIIVSPAIKNKPVPPIETPIETKPVIDQKEIRNPVVAEINTTEINKDSSKITGQQITIASEPLTPVQATKTPITASRRKWQLGVSVNGGLSDTRELDFFHIFGEEKSLMDLSPTASPGSGFAMGPVAAPILISAPEAGLSAGLDFYAEKPISKRLSIRAGIQYQYLSSHIKVGDKIENSRTVNNDFSSVVVNSYYRADNQQNYTNQYHFAGISGYLSWQFIKSKKFSLSWENGLAFNRLIHTNALLFDGATRSYYHDSRAFRKTQLFLSTGLHVPLFNLGSVNVAASPYASFGITPVLKESSFNTHFINYGMKLKFLFPRK